MLVQGDIDLNSVYSFREKKTIKQTMLNHELVFRRQVFELHQLYGVQRAMMESIKQKDLHNYNLHNTSMNLVPVKHNNQIKWSRSKIRQSENINLPYELQQHAFMQKPLDLQLSADEFISQCVGDFSGKRIVTNLEESTVFKHSYQDNFILDLCHSNQPLSIIRDSRLKDKEHRPWKGKEKCSSSNGIIDLEDAKISFSSYDAYPALYPDYPAPKSCSVDMHNLDNFYMSGKKLEWSAQSGIRDGSYGAAPRRSPVDVGPSCETKSLCDSGFNRHHSKLLPANLFNENQESSKYIVNNLDLNTIPFEDPSYMSNNHSMVGNSSITSSSPVLEKVYHGSNVTSSVGPASSRKPDANQLMDLHDTCVQKDLNLEDEKNKCGKVDGFQEGNGVNISHVNLESDSHGELCSGRSDPKNSSLDSSSKIPSASSKMDFVDTVGGEVTLKKVGEPFELYNSCKLSSSSESECMEHQSSSIKTMQSGIIGCDNINISTSDGREKVSIGPLATRSGEQELRSFDSTGSNIQFITKEAEVDRAFQTAAEVLVQISMFTEAYCQGELEKTPLKKKEKDLPQCSSDSYEEMVLNAEESSPYDFCVSSRAFMVDESEKKDVRYKLKRGTRMKDFQKDILPCLSTLARHEIREDINILEGVIRSREYKRMRGKMADGGGDWCRSTRSKRSRAGRKYCA